MTKPFTRYAGLAAFIAAATVALVEVPIAGQAAAAGAPARAAIREVRLPETVPAAPRLAPAGPDRPAACAGQAWPYITPACAIREDGRPIRNARLITAADAVTPSIVAPAEVAPAAAAVTAAPAKPAAEPARAPAKRAAAAVR
ncbi:hypothetical protein [Salinarimonas soli]|uniref:Uncharacterized protein n=1 Tax=Salinarimonas soli TaxID=1638099 RepID=A0A5B2V6I2_9HYPH|nr:hypothetical protein [Salinarimonas soli]KAA2234120.1 hypothetical protein F0L46_24420 [Salinarimonas soli]